MAKADRELAPLLWLAEGGTLAEIIEHLTGPEGWSVLTEANRHWSPLIARAWVLQQRDLGFADEADVKAVSACLPLIDYWNAGRLIAKGRRGDPLAEPIEIAAPSVGWSVVVDNLPQSIIRDPANPRAQIFDVRFMPPVTHQPKQLKTKPWIIATVGRRRAADDIPISITEFSTQLADEMIEAMRVGDAANAVGARRIEAVLRELKLF